MGTLQENSGQLVVMRCWCGIQHAVPASLRTEQLRQHNDGKNVMGVYCPLGHTHVPAGEREVDRLQQRLQAEKRILEAEREEHAQTRAELDHTEHRRRAEKAAKTRLKKRAAAGVCPCCNRTFENLARHMQSKHPDFAEAKRA